MVEQNGIEKKSASGIATIIKHHHNYDYVGIYEKEIFLVQDSDTLDELGIINFWQMFQYSGAIGRDLSSTIKYWEQAGHERKNDCVNKCHFDFSKAIAEKRLAGMNGFMKKVKEECELKDMC